MENISDFLTKPDQLEKKSWLTDAINKNILRIPYWS